MTPEEAESTAYTVLGAILFMGIVPALIAVAIVKLVEWVERRRRWP
jgi:hypothetical protein